MKKKIASISLIVLLIAISGYGTAAFFSDTAVARNVITTGTIDINLSEKDFAGNAFVNLTGVMPGASAEKVVRVENTAEYPCWVRIRLSKEIRLKSEGGAVPDTELISLDIDRENWSLHEGYYYYTKALNGGEATEPLFTEVEFSAQMDNLYQGCEAVISVTVQAVQTAHNGTDVLSAAGWPDEEGGQK